MEHIEAVALIDNIVWPVVSVEVVKDDEQVSISASSVTLDILVPESVQLLPDEYDARTFISNILIYDGNTTHKCFHVIIESFCEHSLVTSLTISSVIDSQGLVK